MMRIELKNICKSYGSLPVLRSLSATLTGHTVLWGPSGCGKTTLARILWGLETPDAGQVIFSGLESAEQPQNPGERRQTATARADQKNWKTCPRLAAVFQEDRLCGQLTAVENAALVCPRGSEKAIRAAFARLGMEGEALATPAALLSGGQRRRAVLVRAALCDAPGAVLDEPFRGLDEPTRAAAITFIQEAFAGKFLLLATHDAAEAAAFGSARLTLPLLAGGSPANERG